MRRLRSTTRAELLCVTALRNIGPERLDSDSSFYERVGSEIVDGDLSGASTVS